MLVGLVLVPSVEVAGRVDKVRFYVWGYQGSQALIKTRYRAS